MDKRPKRRKDKYNPYTLSTESGKYYILFIDVNNHIQKVELSKKLFDSFNKFELEDISQMNMTDIMNILKCMKRHLIKRMLLLVNR